MQATAPTPPARNPPPQPTTTPQNFHIHGGVVVGVLLSSQSRGFGYGAGGVRVSFGTRHADNNHRHNPRLHSGRKGRPRSCDRGKVRVVLILRTLTIATLRP